MARLHGGARYFSGRSPYWRARPAQPSLRLACSFHPPKADEKNEVSRGGLVFSNIYLTELDYFVKQQLRWKPYLRYMDDFEAFIKRLKAEENVRISMDSRGRAYDNIFVERLWWTVTGMQERLGAVFQVLQHGAAASVFERQDSVGDILGRDGLERRRRQGQIDAVHLREGLRLVWTIPTTAV